MEHQSWSLRPARAFSHVGRLWCRFRYPVSLPEDVSQDLGIPLSNFWTFNEVMRRLTCGVYAPSSLYRLMPRAEAERAFETALRKECFCRHSLYSYYFRQGWVEIVLHFDDQQLLRRAYVQHRDIRSDTGIELPLVKAEPQMLATC